MKYLFTTRLGETRYEMSDGGLLCKDVPIGRTGEQLYSASDLPGVASDNSGVIVVERSPAEVFSEATMASFEGMSITIDHPEDPSGAIVFVDPSNWSDLAVGHMQNVRRGTGDQSDLMLADLVLKRDVALLAVERGLREVSLGYDAQYEQISPGRARQINITGNHVALVNKGRAGSRCAIGDKDTMPTPSKHGLKDTFLSVWGRIAKTADAADLEALEPYIGAGDDTGGAPHDPLENPTQDDGDDRLARLEAQVADMAENFKKLSGTGDEQPEELQEETTDDDLEGIPGVTADSASRAEIIVPGITFDADTSDEQAKRQTLAAADKKIVRQVVGDSDISSLPAASLDIVFRAASELAKQRNLRGRTPTGDAGHGTPNTIADINQRNKDYWSKR